MFHGATLPLVKPETLRRIRRGLHHTQERLASALGVSRHTVLRWENGQVPIPALAAKLLYRLKEERRRRT
jgi:DNA-binding transcriptional regulator YiaG